jgi:DNA-binding NtrC family response regulator
MAMRSKILIIDDNEDVVQSLGVLFKLNRIAWVGANTPEEGLALLKEDSFDLIIQDMNFSRDMTSGEEGKRLFNAIRDQLPDIPIILITAWTDLESAVELVRSGASDYLAKPWDDDKLLISINTLLDLNELQSQRRESASKHSTSRRELEQNYNLCDTQFQSDAMLQLLQMATRVAPSNVPLIITGPNGSGKEKIAEVVQANSRCAEGPFIKVNVGALPKDLMEAELFGAEAGSYTGIDKRRLGRFERADGGTLFLDEIGTLPPEGQVKLLRALETGEFERLGGSETIKVDVRVISATNSDLTQAIADGEFREDLYYRLNTIELNVPALKDRREDILPLASWLGGSECQLDDDAKAVLRRYDWPGNVRELQNTIKRAMLLCQEATIGANDLGIAATAASPGPAPEVNAEDIERALQQSEGVVSDAARILGLSRSAFYRRVKKFNIEIP